MASPTLDLMCCQTRKNPATFAPPITSYTNITSAPNSHARQSSVFEYLFNIIIIMSSILSILGAFYTLMPKRGVYRRRRTVVADIRQRAILTWLAVSDLMACLGIFIFAIVRLADVDQEDVLGRFTTDPLRKFCVFATAWIQFFYVCTFIWTFLYALDVYFMLTNRNHPKLLWMYAIGTFLIAGVLVIVGYVFLYRTSPLDHQCSRKKNAWFDMLPHYLAMYIPMIFVMVANPILYWQSFKKVDPLLMASGMYTDRERKIKQQIKVKFLRIILVFYICWTANVINVGTLIYQAVYTENIKLFTVFSDIVWICMAIFNPLQAFLNALVYWGPAGCRKAPTDQDRNPIQDSVSGAESDVEVLRSTPRKTAYETSALLDGW